MSEQESKLGRRMTGHSEKQKAKSNKQERAKQQTKRKGKEKECCNLDVTIFCRKHQQRIAAERIGKIKHVSQKQSTRLSVRDNQRCCHHCSMTKVILRPKKGRWETRRSKARKRKKKKRRNDLVVCAARLCSGQVVAASLARSPTGWGLLG